MNGGGTYFNDLAGGGVFFNDNAGGGFVVNDNAGGGISFNDNANGGISLTSKGSSASIAIRTRDVLNQITGELSFDGQSVYLAMPDFTLQRASGFGIDTFGAAEKHPRMYHENMSNGQMVTLDLSLTETVFKDTGTTPKGIQYAANYASGFTARSLVDKGYVDSLLGGGGGGGDVVGPASSDNTAAARFDGVTGKLLANSGLLLSVDGNISWLSANQRSLIWSDIANFGGVAKIEYSTTSTSTGQLLIECGSSAGEIGNIEINTYNGAVSINTVSGNFRLPALAAPSGLYHLVIDDFGNVTSQLLTGGVTDGNKGDITVSGGGTAWAINLNIAKAWTGIHSFRDNSFRLFNPANTFSYNVRTSAVTANRDITLPLLTGNDTVVFNAFAATLTNKTLGTGTVFSVAPTINDGIKFTFNPNATVAGLNVGAHTADPSAPVNGDIYYDSTNNLLRARINGAWVSLGVGGGIGGSTGSVDNSILRTDGTGGATLQGSNLFIDDQANLILGSSTLAGGSRVIQVASTFTNANLMLEGSGVGSVYVTGGRFGVNNSRVSLLTGISIDSTVSFMRISGTYWNPSAAVPFFEIFAADGVDSVLANGQHLFLRGGNAATNGNGGHTYISYGTKNGSGADGNIGLLTTSVANWQGMERGTFFGNALTAPTGNPTGGGFLFAEGGALKWRGSSGTVTTIAAA
jgi:hypothetical protein